MYGNDRLNRDINDRINRDTERRRAAERGRFDGSGGDGGGPRREGSRLRKLIVVAAIVFVAFWVVSSPSAASNAVNETLTNVKNAVTNLAAFFNGVLE
jgi:hypothetical protein